MVCASRTRGENGAMLGVIFEVPTFKYKVQVQNFNPTINLLACCLQLGELGGTGFHAQLP